MTIANAKEDDSKQANTIQVADFVVSSSTEPLASVEATMNRLIKEYLKFSEDRNKLNSIKMPMGVG